MTQLSTIPFYILSGGPGSGKTTVLKSLQTLGYPCIAEAARTLINQQQQTGGTALPWLDRERYTDLMLEASIRDYHQASDLYPGQVCFFDRGIPDSLCYAGIIGYTPPSALLSEAINCRYRPLVFMFPPWEAIYTTDDARKQSWQEAQTTYHQLQTTYRQLGYTPVRIPEGRPQERADFICQHIT